MSPLSGPREWRADSRALAASFDSYRRASGSVSLSNTASSTHVSTPKTRTPEYGLPVTTVSAAMGHANPAFTLACYGRDPRDTETMVADFLARAAAAGT